MTRLSLSKAWAETRAVLGRDGRLLWPLGLAFIAFPGLVAGQFVPASPMSAEEASGGVLLVLLASVVLSFIGQLAIQWLALHPGERVADAIGHGARAMPRLFLALMLVSIPLTFLVSPFLLVATRGGTAAAGAVLAITAIMVAALFLLVRLLLSSPVAVAERLGPIAMLRRSWQLTRGNTLRLYGFLLLFLALLVIVSGAVTAVLGSIIILVAGQPEPWSVSAVLVGLVSQAAQLAVAVPFTTMLARLYAQAAGSAAPTVPHAP